MIKAELGVGGMRSVYLAEDIVLGRPVAVKRCHLHGPQARKLFAAEAKAQARLLHPNIVTLFDFGYDLSGEAGAEGSPGLRSATPITSLFIIR